MSEHDVQSPSLPGCPRVSRVLTVLLVMQLLLCARAAIAQPRPQVTEIRFGVIDPPVVLQKDVTFLHPTSNLPQAGSAQAAARLDKPIECAGMYYADGKLIILSDRHEHSVFICDVDLKTMKIGTPQQVVIVRNQQYLLQDGESITVVPRKTGGFAAYIFCSLSNYRDEQPLPMRRHMARFTFDATGPTGAFEPSRATVIDGTPVREALNDYFLKLGIAPYRTYYKDATATNKNTYRWANVEGITFTPDGNRLIAGLRNPLTKGQQGDAILFALSNVDLAFDAGDAARMKVTDIFTLDLGDRGISDLCWDPMTKGYLIAAGKSNGLKVDKDQPFPPNTLDSALYWWSGRKSEKPILFATVPEMKIEAICRLGISPFIAIGSDEGDDSEGREQRQSTITVMNFTGFER